MEHTLDNGRVEAFGDRMLGVLNSAALALTTSLGHRTGLFDTMASMEPATPAEIAARAGLQERYVREWLGAMLTGGVVTCEPDTGRFALPPEHAALLTRDSALGNMAAFAQYVPLLGSVEDRLVDCFRQGGGVPYEAYGRFHQVMAEDSAQTVVAALLDHILPLVPGLTERLQAGIDVLDVGCGSGRALNLLAATFPRSRFVGLDLSEEAIAVAREQAERAGSDNLRFVVEDAVRLDRAGRFDLVTAFDAIHDQVEPARVLSAVGRALRDDGVFLMQDIRASSHMHENVDHPVGTFLYTISCMHCMTVSLSGGGHGLGAMWGRQAAERMLADAGFGKVEVHELPHDFQNSYYVARKG